MDSFSNRYVLPSCNLNASTLAELQKRLCNGIPKLLQKDVARIMRGLNLQKIDTLQKFAITVEEKTTTRTLSDARELSDGLFQPGTRRVTVSYRLAAPNLISIDLVFADQGQPYLEITTKSPQVQKHFDLIHDGLVAAIDLYGNRNRLMHNNLLQGFIMLSIPGLVAAYGYLVGIDPFFLYASMGWLCLLACGTTMALPRLFPWVEFATRQRFRLGRLPLLASVSVTLVALACYVSLILYELPRITTPYLTVAGLGW